MNGNEELKRHEELKRMGRSNERNIRHGTKGQKLRMESGETKGRRQ